MINWSELGVFISVCGSVCVSLCFAIQKSHCKTVHVCWGLVNCDRVVPDNIPDDTPDDAAPPNP